MLICIKLNDVLSYPRGGGHGWVFFNWALGFEALGHDVILMDELPARADAQTSKRLIELFAANVAAAGLRAKISVLPFPSGRAPEFSPRDDIVAWTEAASRADLLLNFQYSLAAEIVSRFKRTCLIDIDPGLTQLWIDQGLIHMAQHDVYFTTGETVGVTGSGIPSCGVNWHYSPPAVSLAAWPFSAMPSDGHFTTISNWWGEWIRIGDEDFENSKAEGFRAFIDLPSRTRSKIELSLSLADDSEGVRPMLESKGWLVSNAWERASTPAKYSAFIRESLGEFSCAKPSCLRLANAWVSDRTLCYLASGRPAVVQHTGKSEFLPDQSGLLRFRSFEEATEMLKIANTDATLQGKLARQLVEKHFDATNVCRSMLSIAI